MIVVIENAAQCPSGLYGELLKAWSVPHLTWRTHSAEPAPSLDPACGVLLLGGPMGVHDELRYPFLRAEKALLAELLRREIPALGICLGGQLLAEVLGAPVHARRHGEHGCSSVSLTAAGKADPLFAGLTDPFPSFHWHNDSFEIPAGAAHLAFTPACAGQAFRQGNAWGVQFHPEVDAAIVEDWRRRVGAGIAVSEAFRRQWPELQAVGARLLANFLQIAGLVPSFP